MKITLRTRMGLTRNAVETEGAASLLSQVTTSLTHLPLHCTPLAAICQTPAEVEIDRAAHADPFDFPVTLVVDVPDEHLKGSDEDEADAFARTLVRQALLDLDLVRESKVTMLGDEQVPRVEGGDPEAVRTVMRYWNHPQSPSRGHAPLIGSGVLS